MNEEEKLNETALSFLKEGVQPPDSLEKQVVEELKSRGLIRTHSKRRTHLWKWAAAAVLLLSLFAAGFWAGQIHSEKSASSTGKKLFALFLYEDPAYFQSAENHAEEYSKWIGSVRRQGRFAGGEKLNENGGTITMEQGRLQIKSVPVRRQNLVLAGYFLLEATSYQDALRIAKSCPHIKYGGVVELRPIDPI